MDSTWVWNRANWASTGWEVVGILPPHGDGRIERRPPLVEEVGYRAAIYDPPMAKMRDILERSKLWLKVT